MPRRGLPRDSWMDLATRQKSPVCYAALAKSAGNTRKARTSAGPRQHLLHCHWCSGVNDRLESGCNDG